MNHFKGQPLISPSPSQLSTSSSTQSDFLPSGAFSIIKNGEELSLRPKSPHRYKSSIDHKNSNPERQTKHVRSSTYTSAFSRFIPATELVSFDSEKASEDSGSLEESNDEFQNLHSDDEQNHLIAYPTMPSNRSSTAASYKKIQSISPLASKPPSHSPINLKKLSTQEIWSSYQKFDSILKNFQKLREFKKKNFVAANQMIYCKNCDLNVNFSVKIRNFKQSL